MSEVIDTLRTIELLKLLKLNQLKTPNEFTVEIGKLIRKAREDIGYSQVELAKKINRRPATISDIENGKSEIGILTLILFAIELKRSVSYFFPEIYFKNQIVDLKTPFEHEANQYIRDIEFFGSYEGYKITIGILSFLKKHFEESFIREHEEQEGHIFPDFEED